MMLAYRSAHAKQLLRIFKARNVQQRRLFQNLLNFEQKQLRMGIAQVNDDLDLLKKIITGDES